MTFRTLCTTAVSTALIASNFGCRKNDARQVQYTQIDEANGATISGTVHLSGKAPSPVEIDMAQDPACSMAGTNMSQQYVVNNGSLANVLVYVKDGLGNKLYPVTRTPVVIDQKGCRFTPHVSGAMVGQQVQFINSDPTMHNVHMTPTVAGNDAIDVSQGPNSGPDTRQFHAPEQMIQLRCNDHPWMQAYVSVLSNPFFAVSDTSGHFAIRGLPPGTYTLVADQAQLGQQSTKITVAAKQSIAHDFIYDSAPSK